MSPPLEGVRVLDLADEAAVFAARILADLGADVIRVEPLDGGRVRRRAPFLADEPGVERSCYHLYHNANKRSVTLDLAAERGVELFRRLVRSADVLLETAPPGAWEERGLGHADLRALQPGLVQVSVTPFGRNGPWRDRKANDLVASAAGGLIWVSGSPGDPPVQAGGDQAYKMASLAAATGALLALTGRARDPARAGRHVDISLQECVAMALVQTSHPAYWTWEGKVPGRPGLSAVHRCADDRWVTMLVRPDRLDRFLGWLREAGVADDQTEKRLRTGPLLVAAHPLVRELAARHTRDAFLARAWALDITSLPVNSLEDLPDCEQFQATRQFLEVEHEPLAARLGFPRSPVDALGPDLPLRRAPLLGEHDDEVWGELGIGADERNALRAQGVIRA